MDSGPTAVAGAVATAPIEAVTADIAKVAVTDAAGGEAALEAELQEKAEALYLHFDEDADEDQVEIYKALHAEAAAKDGYVCFYFSATWCKPCKATKPTIVTIADSPDYKDKVKFVIMDTDEWEDLCDEPEHAVTQMPLIRLFKGTEKVDELGGGQNIQKGLKAFLEKHTATFDMDADF